MIDLKKVVIKEKKVDTILTKSNLPIAGYSINPYVGCPFGCEYCYATFMKRFTGHKEDWGMFLDIKMWDKIKNPEKFFYWLLTKNKIGKIVNLIFQIRQLSSSIWDIG